MLHQPVSDFAYLESEIRPGLPPDVVELGVVEGRPVGHDQLLQPEGGAGQGADSLGWVAGPGGGINRRSLYRMTNQFIKEISTGRG